MDYKIINQSKKIINTRYILSSEALKACEKTSNSHAF